MEILTSVKISVKVKISGLKFKLEKLVSGTLPKNAKKVINGGKVVVVELLN